MAVDLTGNWKQVETENLEPYLEAIGINFVMRKMAKTMSPREEIRQDGDNFQFKTIHGWTREFGFKVGVEFQNESGTTKTLAIWDGNKLRIDMNTPKGTMTSEREIRSDGRMYQVLTAPDGTKCTRIFIKQ